MSGSVRVYTVADYTCVARRHFRVAELSNKPERGEYHRPGHDQGKDEIEHKCCCRESALQRGDDLCHAFPASQRHERTHPQTCHCAAEQAPVEQIPHIAVLALENAERAVMRRQLIEIEAEERYQRGNGNNEDNAAQRRKQISTAAFA
jgi:hypothetical protein